MSRKPWWKILAFIILMYVCTMGFLVDIPKLDGRLQHSVRNLFFHVPMWISMMVLFSTSFAYAIFYLAQQNPFVSVNKNGFIYRLWDNVWKWVHTRKNTDFVSLEFARTGLIFSFMGLATGSIWANYQWGSPWSGDPKQNGAAIAVLIYCAYFVLRGSLNDEEKKARIGAVYNIFAFFMLFPTIWILPRLVESLHPGGLGSEGNPGLNPNDTTFSMKLVMLPAFLGWTLLGVWIATLRVRVGILTEKQLNNE